MMMFSLHPDLKAAGPGPQWHDVSIRAAAHSPSPLFSRSYQGPVGVGGPPREVLGSHSMAPVGSASQSVGSTPAGFPRALSVLHVPHRSPNEEAAGPIRGASSAPGGAWPPVLPGSQAAWSVQHAGGRGPLSHRGDAERRQRSVGGCSSGSLAPNSPPMLPRRPPVEVNVEVTKPFAQVQAEAELKQASSAKRLATEEVLGKVEKEVREVKDLVGNVVGMDIRNDLHDVRDRIRSLETLLKANTEAKENVAELEKELECARSAERLCREGMEKSKREVALVKEELRVLREEKETRIREVEEERHFRQAAEQRCKEAAARCTGAEEAIHRAGLQEKEVRIADLERRVKSAADQNAAAKARLDSVQSQLDEEKQRSDALQREAARARQELVELQMKVKQQERDSSYLLQEERQRNEKLQREAAAAQQQLVDLQKAAQQQDRASHLLQEEKLRTEILQKEVVKVRQEWATLQRKSDEQDGAAAGLLQENRRLQEGLSQASGRYQALEGEMRKLKLEETQRSEHQRQQQEERRQYEQETRRLKEEVAARSAEAEELRRSLHRLSESLSHQDSECEKENRFLRTTVHGLKERLFEVEQDLTQERGTANFISPGEWIRTAKRQEQELFGPEHYELRMDLRTAQLEAQRFKKIAEEANSFYELALKYVTPAGKKALEQVIRQRRELTAEA